MTVKLSPAAKRKAAEARRRQAIHANASGMRSKVTPANLRVGQTVYFPDHFRLAHHREAHAAHWRVGSDATPMPKRFVSGALIPRDAILEYIERYPGSLSFSRRSALTAAHKMRERAESVEKLIMALQKEHAPHLHTLEGRTRLSHAIADVLEEEGLIEPEAGQ